MAPVVITGEPSVSGPRPRTHLPTASLRQRSQDLSRYRNLSYTKYDSRVLASSARRPTHMAPFR